MAGVLDSKIILKIYCKLFLEYFSIKKAAGDNIRLVGLAEKLRLVFTRKAEAFLEAKSFINLLFLFKTWKIDQESLDGAIKT